MLNTKENKRLDNSNFQNNTLAIALLLKFPSLACHDPPNKAPRPRIVIQGWSSEYRIIHPSIALIGFNR